MLWRRAWLLLSLLFPAQPQEQPSSSVHPEGPDLRLWQLADTTTSPLPPNIPRPADFCQKPPYNDSHVMCMTQPFTDCITYFVNSTLLSESVLWMHNHYRSHLALGRLADFPAAGNMLQLRWDDELARVAEAKARLCADHIGSLNVHVGGIWTVDFPDVGISMQPQKTDDETAPVIWRFVVRDWFDQNIFFPKEHVAKFAQTFGTEQFVQLAAADTYAVGCSYTRNIMPKTVLPEKYFNIYVCLYGPRAPLVGKPLYYAAPYCSLCPQDTICDVPSGLCVLRSSKPGPPRHPPLPDSKKDDGNSTGKQAASEAVTVVVSVVSPIVMALLALYGWRQGDG
ncbi:venom allergen 5 [Rhipicephalus microplus]|uniref:venom allergen 5 n=1 Tax=Rhipicephalus microplus TaxID=6941 RepID=UPI003F6C927E